jgi:hypothetical protein
MASTMLILLGAPGGVLVLSLGGWEQNHAKSTYLPFLLEN